MHLVFIVRRKIVTSSATYALNSLRCFCVHFTELDINGKSRKEWWTKGKQWQQKQRGDYMQDCSEHIIEEEKRKVTLPSCFLSFGFCSWFLFLKLSNWVCFIFTITSDPTAAEIGLNGEWKTGLNAVWLHRVVSKCLVRVERGLLYLA